MKIYVMGSTRHMCRYKIGISKNVENRRKNIESSIKGGVYVIFSCPLLAAYFWEQLLHLIYSPFNDRKMKGSGRTEWFWLFVPVTPILLICTIFCLEIGSIGAGVILTIQAITPQTEHRQGVKSETQQDAKKQKRLNRRLRLRYQ